MTLKPVKLYNRKTQKEVEIPTLQVLIVASRIGFVQSKQPFHFINHYIYSFCVCMCIPRHRLTYYWKLMSSQEARYWASPLNLCATNTLWDRKCARPCSSWAPRASLTKCNTWSVRKGSWKGFMEYSLHLDRIKRAITSQDFTPLL